MTQATDTEMRDLLLGLDKKIDGVDKKLDVHMARTEEQLKGINARFADIKVQLRSQDDRLWFFVLTIIVAGFWGIAKFAFSPGGQP
jgi:hypothetical protein